MPKVKITTDRQPWVDDKPQPEGAVVEVDKATADILVGHGFAEIVAAPKKAAAE